MVPVRCIVVCIRNNVSLLGGAAVCQRPVHLHAGAEHQRPEGVDQPHEEDHPDGRGSGRPLRAVEGPQRDRRREWSAHQRGSVGGASEPLLFCTTFSFRFTFKAFSAKCLADAVSREPQH